MGINSAPAPWDILDEPTPAPKHPIEDGDTENDRDFREMEAAIRKHLRITEAERLYPQYSTGTLIIFGAKTDEEYWPDDMRIRICLRNLPARMRAAGIWRILIIPDYNISAIRDIVGTE